MRAIELWDHYTAWLAKNAPASHANLAPPANDAEVTALEQALGTTLPPDVKAVWKRSDGQRETMIASNIVPGTVCLPTLSFLSTRFVTAVWREWETLRASTDLGELHQACRSVVPGVVRPLYTHAGWIPLWSDPTRADYIGLDLAPDHRGTPGQIINFGRNEDDHFCCAQSFTELLEILVAEVESGAWPASEMGYGDRMIPWLGDPKKSFFNALYARAEKRQPAPLTVGQQLSAALSEGRAALELNDFGAANAAIERARSLKAQHAPTEDLFVRILAAQGDLAGAQQAFEALLAWAPRYPSAGDLRALLAANR